MKACTAGEVLKTMQPGLYTSAIVFLNANLNYNPETKVIGPSLDMGATLHYTPFTKWVIPSVF